MLSENIKKLCAARGITVAELERAVNLGNGLIAKWDTCSPRLNNAQKVADYFGVTVDDLLRPGPEEVPCEKTP